MRLLYSNLIDEDIASAAFAAMPFRKRLYRLYLYTDILRICVRYADLVIPDSVRSIRSVHRIGLMSHGLIVHVVL